MADEKQLRIVLMGDGGVGKSALVIQFTTHNFVSDYDPTIENSYRKQVSVDERSYVLDLIDTAGQEELQAMRNRYIVSGQGFILVYSIIDNMSIGRLDPIINQISRMKDVEQFPMVLCGNKADLTADREVPTGEGQAYADNHGAAFFETSALTRQNVDNTFHQMVREILKHESPGTGPITNTPRRRGTGCALL